MHGKLPFPEATATTEVLVSGEKKGNQAKVLAVSGLVGGLYDFIASSVGLWTETISTRVLTWGEMIADKFKVVFKVNTGAAVLGLGYIVGLKYAAFICAGSFTVWFVLIPLISYFAPGMTLPVGEGILQTVGEHDARGALLQLRPSARYRRYRHGRYHRHHQILENHPSGAGACR